MLRFEPTKHGTGIKVLGDYGDLNSLHQTFWNLMPESRNISMRERVRLLSIMSYEVRHAMQHYRLCETISYDDQNEVTYYGCQIDWICMLFTISCLRYNAGYTSLSQQDQANLMLLEYLTERAMNQYDQQGASTLKYFINSRINIADDLIYHIYQAVWYDFMTLPAGKQRFRKISELISKYSTLWSPDYKILKAHFEQLTQDGTKTICDYETHFEDITIKW